MTRRAEVERLAVPELGADIRAYVARMRAGQSAVSGRLADAEAACRRATDEARRDLSVAMEQLAACRQQENADTTWAVATVDRAKARLAAMYGVATDVASLRSQYEPAARRFESATEVLAQQVQRELGRAEQTLDAYLGRSHGGGPSGGGPHTAGTPPVNDRVSQPAGFPDGVFMVPLSLVDDADTRVQGPGEFSEYYTPAALEWAHEAFISVIAPGIAAGATIDTFRDLDQAENRMGTRSYAMTYQGFLGTDAIVLSPAGAGLEVNNGYHRIWVARRMGLTSVPARVVGHGAS
ncbi:MAG TPA: hypothetical protein VNR62_04140 [Cellulomonas sp.]|nr:hypothetical protein [Cellulomonas sp.]